MKVPPDREHAFGRRPPAPAILRVVPRVGALFRGAALVLGALVLQTCSPSESDRGLSPAGTARALELAQGPGSPPPPSVGGGGAWRDAGRTWDGDVGDYTAHRGDRDFIFHARRDVEVASCAESVVTGDVDEDGHIDLVVPTNLAGVVTVLRGTGQGLFREPVEMPFPGQPGSALLVDLDRDGHLDLAVNLTSAQEIWVSLGRGDGSFGEPDSYPISRAQDPASHGLAMSLGRMVAGDADGDGNPDLLVILSGGGTENRIGILYGHGDGTLAAVSGVDAGGAPGAVALGDLDGDPHPDLVVARYETDDIVVLRGRGKRRYRVAGHYPVGTGPSSVDIGDLDGDGVADVVVSSQRGNDVHVLRGVGGGELQSVEVLSTAQEPDRVSILGIDGDAHPDLAVVCGGSDIVQVFEGHGDGTFGEPWRYTAGHCANDVAQADLDEDGLADLVVSSCDGRSVSLYLNMGRGQFMSEPLHSVAGSTPWLAAGDVDGDGAADLLTLATPRPSLALSRNRGRGRFQEARRTALAGRATAAAAGDFDGDGLLDVVLAERDTGALTVYGGTSGALVQTAKEPLAGARALDLTAGDVDRDGDLDLVVLRVDGRGYQVVLGAGDGSFVASVEGGGVAGARTVGLGRIDGDPWLDLIFQVDEDRPGLYVERGLAGGTFDGSPQPWVEGTMAAHLIEDLDGDGHTDVAWTRCSASAGQRVRCEVAVAYGAGDGSVGEATVYDASEWALTLVAADLDVDGHKDLIVANSQASNLSVFFGGEDRGFEPMRSFGTAMAPFSLAVADLNGDGLPDVAVGHQFFGDQRKVTARRETERVTLMLNRMR